MPPATSTVSRKRTRSSNVSESTDETSQTSSTSNTTPSHAVPPKRQRNNTNYSLRNRPTAPETSQTSTPMSSAPSQRYNLRPRTTPSQASTSQSTSSTARTRRQIPSAMSSSIQSEQAIPSVSQPRQFRFVYISDDDDPPATTQSSSSSAAAMNTTLNLITDDEDEEPRRAPPPTSSRRAARSAANTRTRTHTDPTSASSTENSDHSTNGTGHIRFNRAIEIVIDSIQSLEGAVNNFDQLFFSLIYDRLSTRTEFESFEGMIRLSRILSLNFPSRLTQDEIDALPKIQFSSKSNSSTSLLLVEKCPICLTEFTDEEIINQLHCSHLFHLPCISTWLSENDSCPTCRRKANGD